ncbi:ATP-dependent Clp protease adaptor ClpS [Pendulispora albinea]|uniref:ATP-dependent Clp protease adapter protein ClpS n=1 Tax=Pendulispora albinea TaxID=2741071 RepID=A0ABZ2LNP7_9BACT
MASIAMDPLRTRLFGARALAFPQPRTDFEAAMWVAASEPKKPLSPNSPQNPQNPGGPGGPGESGESDVDVDERTLPRTVRRYKVVFHNDDYTTMEFVVDCLMTFFHKSETEATHVMLTVHRKGSAVAGVYSREVAETKVAQVMDHARKHGMPLLVTAEPE